MQHWLSLNVVFIAIKTQSTTSVKGFKSKSSTFNTEINLNANLHLNLIEFATYLEAFIAIGLFWFRKIWLVKRNIIFFSKQFTRK